MKATPTTDKIRIGHGGNSPMGRMRDHPDHYQSLLGDVIRKYRPKIMIETGVESGYSTEHYLKAMDDVGVGHLYSCDPSPSGFYEAYPIIHHRFTFMKEKSFDACPKIFAKHGLIDLFLHDSDHSWECQTWEYHWAWHHVRSGGIIASDDTMWGTTLPWGVGSLVHGAWQAFCRYYGVSATKINNAEYFVKP